MKRILKISSLFFIIFIVFSCTENDVEKIQLQEIAINFQETKDDASNDFSITFSKVIEDSRCPEISNVNCVWEGRIGIELILNNLDKKIIGLGNLKVIDPDLKYTNSIEYKGYLIQLINVNQKDNLSEERKEMDYTISLKIEKI